MSEEISNLKEKDTSGIYVVKWWIDIKKDSTGYYIPPSLTGERVFLEMEEAIEFVRSLPAANTKISSFNDPCDSYSVVFSHWEVKIASNLPHDLPFD